MRERGERERERHRHTEKKLNIYSMQSLAFLKKNTCAGFYKQRLYWQGEVARSSQRQAPKDVRCSQEETRVKRSGLGQRAVEQRPVRHGKDAHGRKLGQGPCIYTCYLVCVLLQLQLLNFSCLPSRYGQYFFIARRDMMLYMYICWHEQLLQSPSFIYIRTYSSSDLK